MRRLWTFSVVVWLVSAIIGLGLLGWPLVMNTWAGSHWTEMPCSSGSILNQYLYVVDGTVYISTHRDFWQMGGRSDRGVSDRIQAPDGRCWVNPHDPEEAVHFLDAPRNWSNAGGRVSAIVVLLAAAGGITVFGRKRPGHDRRNGENA
jgi:hypothetical protein